MPRIIKLNPKISYQLKIIINNIKPPIWRKLVVNSDIRLPDLHKVFQTIMGWTNSHLHQFRINGEMYSLPDDDNMIDYIDYRKVRLNQVVYQEKQIFFYDYDFGDGWEHTIKLEKILPESKTKLKYPICLAGKRKCPPEDCGGPFGYAELLTIIKNPKHNEYAEMKEWLGDGFLPEEFDIDLVNEMLRTKDFGCFSLFD